MRECPFCGYDEGYTREAIYQKPIKYKVVCNVCGASGHESKTREMAEKKWDGLLNKIQDQNKFNKILSENFINEDLGGVSTPMSTPMNTPGMGNVVPAPSAGLNTNGPSGSGDKWDSSIGKIATNESVDSELYNGPKYVQYEGGNYEVIDYRERGPKPEILIQNLRTGYGVKNYHGGVYAKPSTFWITIDEIEYPNDETVYESNLNPYDQIGQMMAKKMGVKSPFKRKDSVTNTVVQDNLDGVDLKEGKFTIETLDSYEKASKDVPKHPLQKKSKKVNEGEEETPSEIESTKDVKSKKKMSDLGIPFVYKPGPSGKKRVYLKMNVNDAVEKLEELGWEEQEVKNNPNKTVKIFRKDNEDLTIYTDGKDLPRVTLKPTPKEIDNENVEESFQNTNMNKFKKLISNTLEPYMKFV